jgi:TDG/mug DNA glycosylase family protein
MPSSFDAVARPDARVLILGTLPGAESLLSGQYYAQPQNLFWRIMDTLIAAGLSMPYEQRLQRLTQARLALWDVCTHATRLSSLDARIVIRSVVPNDFEAFLETHDHLERICFNGKRAAAVFQQLVAPRLGRRGRRYDLVTLPSTSAANAALPFEEKLNAWRQGLLEGAHERPALDGMQQLRR